jgi:hypothetical protein
MFDRTLLAALALSLTGCAQASWHPLPQQPHALITLPAALPFCVFMCRVMVTVGEGVATQAVQTSESNNMGGPALPGIPGVTQ